MPRRHLLFFAPLAAAAAAVALVAVVRARLQLDWPVWAYGLFLTSLACVSWRASGRFDGPQSQLTRLDWHRAGMLLLLGLVIGAASGVLRCGITSQPLSTCLALPRATEIAFVFVVVAPLFEEILLRGYLGRLLSLAGAPVLLQLALQGSLFTFTHGGLTSSSRLALFFAAGLLLTLLAIATQGLLASLSLHIGWNTSQLLVSGDLRGTGLTSDTIAAASDASRFAGAAALFIVAVAVWRQWMSSSRAIPP